MRIQLTDKRLSQPAKKNRREELFDNQVRGLKARRGARTGWVFGVQGPKRVGPDGKTIRLWKTLGPWSPSIRDAAGKKLTVGLSVAEARIAALETLQEESESLPKTGRVRNEDSVRALAESFLAQKYPENERRREKVKALLETHALPTIGGMDVRSVTRAHCNLLVREAMKKQPGKVHRGGKAPATMLLRVLRDLFQHAVSEGQLATEAESPASLLKPARFSLKSAKKGDRWLTAEELAALFLHPEVDLPSLLSGKPRVGFPDLGLSIAVRGAIVLGPHLAVRPAALVGLRWDEVDFKAATATIRGGRGAKVPFDELATAKDFVVPLSTTASALLEALQKAQAFSGVRSPHVFPTASKGGHLTGDVYADALMRLTRVRKEGGARIPLPGGKVRPHDARRTFAVTATRLGVQELIVERCLQHSRGKVTDTYFVAGSELELRREAHERVDEYWTAVREGRTAKVVPMVVRR